MFVNQKHSQDEGNVV